MFHSKPEDNRSENDLLRTLLSPDMEKERYICSLALLSGTYLYYDYSAWPLGRAGHLFTCFSSRGFASHVFLKLQGTSR